MNKILVNVLMILAIYLVPQMAPATTFLNSKTPGFEADTIYDDDVFISGYKVRFNSTVHGDLMAFSYEMVQSDTIDGNFMAFTYSTQNLGPVSGSMRVIARSVSCNTEVGRNLLLFCQEINIGPQAHIGWDADLTAGDIVFQGTVERNLNLKAGNAVVGGRISGDLNFKGDSLTINPNTIIDGNLNYKSSKRATIGDGTKIGGEINWTRAELEKKSKHKEKNGFEIFMSWVLSFRGYMLYSMIIYILATVLLILPFPGPLAILFLWIILGVSGNIIIYLTKKRAFLTQDMLATRPFPSLGLGFILFFLGPIISIILFFTIIGSPLAVLLIMIFGIFMFLGSLYVCLFTGRRLCRIFNRRSSETPGYLCFTIGLIILVLLSFIPIIGYILTVLIMMFGLGGLVMTFWRPKIKPQPEPLPPPPVS